MRLIDADALERDGWRMSRTVQIDEKTMEAQTRKPTDFPTIEPERIRGRWHKISPAGIYECSVCGQNVMTNDIDVYHYCHGCGAKMEDQDE